MSTISFLKKKIPKAIAKKEVMKISATIAEAISPKAIILFGSFARGEMTDQSDIDLLIVVQNRDRISQDRKTVASLRPITQTPMDIVWMTFDDYIKKRKVGGIARVATAEGRILWGDLN